jgi:hypothetical protein
MRRTRTSTDAVPTPHNPWVAGSSPARPTIAPLTRWFVRSTEGAQPADARTPRDSTSLGEVTLWSSDRMSVAGPSLDANPDARGKLLGDWQVHLRAGNVSPASIDSYARVGCAFCSFLVTNGMPERARDLTRDHVEPGQTPLRRNCRPNRAPNPCPTASHAPQTPWVTPDTATSCTAS